MSTAPLIFWIALAILFHTYLGYPLLMAILAWLRDEPPAKPLAEMPTVTVVLAAYNESSRIVERLRNLLASDYPPELMDFVVVCDGSTDDTATRVHSFADPRVKQLTQPRRLGKAAALNRAVAQATGEIIVFADVRQRFAPDAIRRLVSHFGHLETGAVSGELVIDRATTAAGSGVDSYWRLEKFIRRHEARWDSAIGCTGAIYAIRGKLFQPIPEDTILDDVVIPMQIAMQRYRIGFDPEALAFDPQTLEPEREQVRKRRTLAGNYQMLFRYPVWLLPVHSRLWWQLLSHKYLRLAAPYLLLAAFVSNAIIAGVNIYGLLFGGQILFYGLAAVGLQFRHLKYRVISLPAGFVFLNWQALVAFWQYLRNPKQAAWQMAGK